VTFLSSTPRNFDAGKFVSGNIKIDTMDNENVTVDVCHGADELSEEKRMRSGRSVVERAWQASKLEENIRHSDEVE